ncbi:MAG: isochorismate synthase [Sphingobium sp.]|nr:isochorismate synthase [Sphingobium sp.]
MVTETDMRSHITLENQYSSSCSFALQTPDAPLFTNGMARPLPPGPAHSLGERVRQFFRETPVDASSATNGETPPALLVGAIPFDIMADDFLFQPESLSPLTPLMADSTRQQDDLDWRVLPQPDRTAYQQAVSKALDIIAASHAPDAAADKALDKIVLSRSLLLHANKQINPLAIFRRLKGDPGAVRFMTPVGNGPDGVMRHLVGATPELLLSRKGASVLSHPLAGSAPRSNDAAQDEAAAASLTGSAKDQREHRWVTEAILDALTPYCAQLSAPKHPSLVSTQTMWHLGTRIEGTLKHPEEVSSAQLAAMLHPTPAVGGFPRNQALPLIPQLEGYDRSFYAGAVGWNNAAGDGAWYVSLRCAQISGNQARICAGAGIVEGSVPRAEADETSAKLLAILRALGIDEAGRPVASPEMARIDVC